MEFSTTDGPTVLVDVGSAGQRVHGFASRCFREQLGRVDGRQHSSVKHSVLEHRYLVNGLACENLRRVLNAGDAVTLCVGRAASSSQSTTPVAATPLAGRRRMNYEQPTSETPPTPACTTSKKKNLRSSAAAAFSAYYRAQQLVSECEWSEAERLFHLPMPLCVRANRSSRGKSRTSLARVSHKSRASLARVSQKSRTRLAQVSRPFRPWCHTPILPTPITASFFPI
jgi:hypothetical protein